MTNEKITFRAIHIDILRIIACLFVIFNHTNERGFYRYISDELGAFIWWKNLFFSILCKAAVPIFFMISGSLFLRKEEPIIKTYKRIPKILIDVILFSILYYWIDAIISQKDFSLINTLNNMLHRCYWHLWYLYSYITLMITMPVLRKMVKELDLKIAFYLFAIASVTAGIIPIIEYYFIQNINGNLKPTWKC